MGYIDVIGHNLLYPPGTDGKPGHHRGLTYFYRSCLLFLNRTEPVTIDEALELLHAPRQLWLEVNDFQDLLVVMSKASMYAGLCSAVNITNRNAVVQVDVGATLVSLVDANFLEDYIAGMIKELNLTEKTVQRDVLKMDRALENVRMPFTRTDPFRFIEVADIDVLNNLLDWVYVLNASLPNLVNPWTKDTLIMLRGRTEIERMLLPLSRVDLKLATLYSLLVAATQLLRWDRTRTPPLQGDSEYSRINYCVMVTADYFKDLMPEWAAETSQERGSLAEAEDIIDNVNLAIVKKYPNLTYFTNFRPNIHGTCRI